jgi:hypothetical protein
MLTTALAAASSASAERIWEVAGDQLHAGESTALTASGENLLIKGKLSSLAVEIKCTKQGSKELRLEGGEPGKVSGLLELSKCTAAAPANCTIKETYAMEVLGELVEDTKAAKALLLFAPKKAGGAFAEFKFEGGSCGLNGKTAKMTGNVAAEISPESSGEATSATFSFPSKAITAVLDAEGKEKTVGTKFGSEEATLSGKTTAKLTSGEQFSVFDLAFDITPPAEYTMQKQKQKVKIKARIAATITEIKMLVGAATFKIEPNTCVKAYAANAMCEVEVEFNPAVMGNYIGIFAVHVMGDPANVFETAILTGKF